MGDAAYIAQGADTVGDLTGAVDLSTIGSVGILTLAVLGILFGLIYPKSAMTRAWKIADDKETENKELRATLDKQAGLMEKLVEQVADMKVTAQATLYAMQEIQIAGRHAAGMDPIQRTAMQRQTDDAHADGSS